MTIAADFEEEDPKDPRVRAKKLAMKLGSLADCVNYVRRTGAEVELLWGDDEHVGGYYRPVFLSQLKASQLRVTYHRAGVNLSR